MLRFPPSLIAPDFQIIRTQPNIFAVSSTLIIPANADRVCLIFGQATGGTVWVDTINQTAGTQGLIVPTANTPLTFTFAEHGPLVGLEWWARASTPISIFCYQVIYRPRG